ncbi:MAG: hypothetical protein KJ804_01925 [Proteobacteria bacterium]|nr:hypothetical protein [Pseudomonadota bacterium]MBU1057064.1 hypothetical protein [Pseudomonadota bacterium]
MGRQLDLIPNCIIFSHNQKPIFTVTLLEPPFYDVSVNDRKPVTYRNTTTFTCHTQTN